MILVLTSFLMFYLFVGFNDIFNIDANVLVATISVLCMILATSCSLKEKEQKIQNQTILRTIVVVSFLTYLVLGAVKILDLIKIGILKADNFYDADIFYGPMTVGLFFIFALVYFLCCDRIIENYENKNEPEKLKLKFLHSKVIFINKEKSNKLEISNLSNINQMIKKYPVYAQKIADKLKEFEKYINMSKSHVIYLSNEQYENLKENEVVNFMFFATEIYKKTQEHGIVNSDCLQQKRKESDFDCLEDFKIYLNQLDFYKELFDFYSLKLRVKDFLNEKMSKNINDNELKFILELLDKDLELEEDKTAKFIKNCEKRFEKIKNNAMFGMIN